MSAQRELLKQLRLADAVGRRVMLKDIAARYGRGFADQLAGALDVEEGVALVERNAKQISGARGRRRR